MSIRDLKGEKIIIWPSYFLAESRIKGRRSPKIKCSLENIISVCKSLGLEPEFLQDKQFPRSRKYKGAIVVKKVQSKRKTIRLISESLRKE